MLGAAMLEGLPPNNAAHLMRLRCDEATARRVADVIVETFDPAETAAAAFEEATSTTSWNTGPWLVEAYFGRAPDEPAVRALIAAAAGNEAAAAVTFGTVAEVDWVASALTGLTAVRCGRFVVHGAHDRACVRAHEIGIEIEAALAFGTGHHGTTRGCLQMFERLLRVRRPGAVLDVGTGTGVLAIAAARTLRRPVVAGDIDAVSVVTARANARANRAGSYVRPVRARGTGHPALAAGAPYDLIFANILARPLRDLAPALRRLLAPGGHIVLSGLLARDVPGVLAAYRAQALPLVARRDIEGWATLCVTRRQAYSIRPDHRSIPMR